MIPIARFYQYERKISSLEFCAPSGSKSLLSSEDVCGECVPLKEAGVARSILPSRCVFQPHAPEDPGGILVKGQICCTRSSFL